MLVVQGFPSSALGDISIGEAAIWIVGAASLVTMMWRQSKALKPFADFFRDWNGEKSRPGVDGKPGVMERLQSIEKHLNDAPSRAEFAKLQHEAVLRAEFSELQAQVVRLATRLDVIIPPLPADLQQQLLQQVERNTARLDVLLSPPGAAAPG